MQATPVPPRGLPRRSLGAGLLIGIGVAGFVDEVVFHQLLQWHHFYDGSTSAVGLVSDGWFHAGSWLAVVAGLFVFADLQRCRATVLVRVVAGALLGWGGFQLYDGLVQHKVLGLHQIRYGVDLALYDLVWNAAAVLGIAAGFLLLLRNRRRHRAGLLT